MTHTLKNASKSCNVFAIDTKYIRPNPDHERDSGWGDRIDDLAADIEMNGQLQPALVREVSPGQYEMIAGHRRMAACVQLKIPLQCVVYYGDASELDAEMLLRFRAAENLEREPLSPAEEATLVNQLFVSMGLEEAAAYLGHTEKWVMDRVYIHALSGETRKMLADGRLVMGHVRELAKIGDAEARDRMARSAARSEDGTGGMSVSYLRSQVNRMGRSLKLATWELDAKFAGKRACTGCPANSSTDPALFATGGTDAVGDLTCTNRRCYDVKLNKATAVIAAALTVNGEKLGALGSKDRPAGIKQSSWNSALRRKKDEAGLSKPAVPKPGAKKASPSKKSASPWSPENQKARQAHYDAVNKASKVIEEALIKEAAGDPHALACFSVLFVLGLPAEIEKKHANQIVDVFRQRDWKKLPEVVKAAMKDKSGPENLGYAVSDTVRNFTHEALAETAKLLDVEIPEIPPMPGKGD